MTFGRRLECTEDAILAIQVQVAVEWDARACARLLAMLRLLGGILRFEFRWNRGI
jgi:hypothetical protein